MTLAWSYLLTHSWGCLYHSLCQRTITTLVWKFYKNLFKTARTHESQYFQKTV